LIFAALFLVSLLLAEGFLTAAGRLLIYSDPLQDSDVIAVLSGGGTPRLQEAARLYQEHQADFIILTETGLVTDKFGSLSSIEKNQLEVMGVQSRDIFITPLQVESTTEEARAIRKLVNTRGFKSVIVVTDTFHSRRAHLIFQDAFKGNNLTIIIRPVRDDWYKAATWWTSLEGWQTTLLEYSKLFAYLFESRIMH
jgi:uncharacterized SAM-binding protein YcdF (DUF218 family)